MCLQSVHQILETAYDLCYYNTLFELQFHYFISILWNKLTRQVGWSLIDRPWGLRYFSHPTERAFHKLNQKIIIKKTQRKEDRKDRATDSRQQNIRRWGLWYFSSTLCVCMRLAITSHRKTPNSYQKCLLTQVTSPLSSTACSANVAILWLLEILISCVHLLTSWLLDYQLNLVFDSTDQRPWSLPPLLPFSNSRFTRTQPFVHLGKKTTHKQFTQRNFFGKSMPSKDAEDKNSLNSDGHPQTHTMTYTPIYIYIYIHECILLCHCVNLLNIFIEDLVKL